MIIWITIISVLILAPCMIYLTKEISKLGDKEDEINIKWDREKVEKALMDSKKENKDPEE